ncbi:hypothetical protein QE152_g24477 [Popillia japonica]|uniref:Uncharacterized protein n=1 Tax=Popillia japonica TaxID=7064 RepID=A0AAW1KEN2_POPJA
MTEDEIISDLLDNSDEDEVEERTTSSTVSTNMHTVNNDTAMNAFALERTTSSTVSTNMHTVNNDTAMNAFALQIAITWAEENGVSLSDILMLSRLQECVDVSFDAKKTKKHCKLFSC